MRLLDRVITKLLSGPVDAMVSRKLAEQVEELKLDALYRHRLARDGPSGCGSTRPRSSTTPCSTSPAERSRSASTPSSATTSRSSPAPTTSRSSAASASSRSRARAATSSSATGCGWPATPSSSGPVTIGEHAVVAGGSLVREDVEPYTVVAGRPAKVVKKIGRPGPEVDPGREAGDRRRGEAAPGLRPARRPARAARHRGALHDRPAAVRHRFARRPARQPRAGAPELRADLPDPAGVGPRAQAGRPGRHRGAGREVRGHAVGARARSTPPRPTTGSSAGTPSARRTRASTPAVCRCGSGTPTTRCSTPSRCTRRSRSSSRSRSCSPTTSATCAATPASAERSQSP